MTFLREGFGFNFQTESVRRFHVLMQSGPPISDTISTTSFLPNSSIELQQQNSSDQDIKNYLRSIDRRIGDFGTVGCWIGNSNSQTPSLIVNVDMQRVAGTRCKMLNAGSATQTSYLAHLGLNVEMWNSWCLNNPIRKIGNLKRTTRAPIAPSS
ncbi:hypothetical protein BofuT4_P079080.1 [Botrytis cinerea T4]|uniref:Uncharacterized protein n=1 Tax=Botryotinia fuckeliana (strain T4) TaxID=999810 RepID=G2YL95_BOTF4|nr:hypothetical protein BofuT4_P079080.1 [Botrytis cinerea T4]